MRSSRVGFARWRSDVASGGNRYDDELADGLRALGLDLREYVLTGAWPLPEPHDLRQLVELLTGEREWLVDNIIGSAAPEAITEAVGAGRRVTMLMHYFPADDPRLSPSCRQRLAAAEAEAVRAASAIVVTSAWAASEVSSRYGRHDAVVALPGVERAPLALGSVQGGRPAQLLWLARLTQVKDPLLFVEALDRLQDLHWTAKLVGPDTLDECLSREVRQRLGETGLADRVEVPGSREGDALESVWAGTDLLLHTSRSETYGMVVSEALARGIPSIVPSGTGAAEAQGVGGTFLSGDVGALADAIRKWLTDPHLQELWRNDASRVRENLATWEATAKSVFSVLAQ